MWAESAGEADRTRVLHGQRGGDGAVQGAEAAAAARGPQDRRPRHRRRRQLS